MEKEKTLQENLDDLRAVAPDAAEYIELFIGTVVEPSFEDSYRDNPEAVLHCFSDGVDADLSEIIHYLEGSSSPELQAAVQAFANSLRAERPVAFFVLKKVFRHFHLSLEEPEDEDSGEVSYYIENKIFERRDLEKFFRACGLVADTMSGKGSHTNWYDSEGRFIHSSTNSNKAYLSTVAKKMLRAGLSMDALRKGCDEMGVDFKVYND